MKKIFVLLIFGFALFSIAKADQYLDINNEFAQKALKLLDSENEAVIYCPSCEDTSKRYIKNTTYSYGNT